MTHQREDDSATDALQDALATEGEEYEEAFRQLFLRFWPRLLGFFRRHGISLERARELSQETFLRVYRSRGRFRGESSLVTWLFTIAENLYLSELRRRGTAKRKGTEVSLTGSTDDDTGVRIESLSADSPPPSERVEEREAMEAINRAFAKLPARQQQVMRLRLGQQRSIAQIAILLNISESTVKVHLHKGRQRLRENLQPASMEDPR